MGLACEAWLDARFGVLCFAYCPGLTACEPDLLWSLHSSVIHSRVGSIDVLSGNQILGHQQRRLASMQCPFRFHTAFATPAVLWLVDLDGGPAYMLSHFCYSDSPTPTNLRYMLSHFCYSL
jgi:hypothetical protein